MRIDTEILQKLILKEADRKDLSETKRQLQQNNIVESPLDTKMRAWRKVLNLSDRVLRRRLLGFQGTITTDGVSITCNT